MRTFGILMFAAIVWVSNANAQTITECGDSEGYAYYFAGGVVPQQEAGMRKDAVTGGRIIILNFENNEVDLILKGATGSTVSTKRQGGKIVVLPSGKGIIALSVFFDGGSTVETYLFQLDKGGNGTVVYTRMVSTEMMSKQSLMQSHCAGPRR